MAATNKALLGKLQKTAGVLTERHDVHADVLRSRSVSLNSTFGKGWGLPRGMGIALYGPPKGGKSLLLADFAGALHQSDPDAIVVKIDTEFRDEAQFPEPVLRAWGIDPNRYICRQTNSSAEVFDWIADEKEGLYGMIKEGLPIKLVVIDSISSIRGRRMEQAESSAVMQRGDDALTIQNGLKWITEAQKRGKFGLIATVQIRAEQDEREQMRGNKVKMAASYGLQHHFEYFMYVEPNRNKEGRTDLQGNEYKDEGTKDAAGNAETVAHRIRAVMKDSSFGVIGRVGEFTIDHRKNAIINVHEEIFKLAKGRGIIERPNNLTWIYKGKKWTGEGNMIRAIAESKDLQAQLLKDLIAQDNDMKFNRALEAAAGLAEPEAPEAE